MNDGSTLKKLIWLRTILGTGGGTITTVTGTPPLSLVNALAKPIKSLTQYGKCVTVDGSIYCNNGVLEARHESGLPIGATLLRSAGNAASTLVNTGIVPDVDDFELEIQTSAVSGSFYLLQSRASRNGAITGISGANSGRTIIGNSRGGSATSSITRTSGDVYTIRLTAKDGNLTLYVKNEDTGVEDVKTDTYEWTGATEAPFCIFGNTTGDRLNGGSYVRYAWMKKGGSLVCNYIPCIYDSEVGFWDTVSDTFFGATEGSLVAGAELPDPVVVAVSGTLEELTVTASGADAQTASVVNLFAVGDVQDEQDVIRGKVTHRTEAVIDNGEIIVRALAEPVIEHVIPQPLSTTDGDNTVSVISNVDPVTLKVEFMASTEA